MDGGHPGLISIWSAERCPNRSSHRLLSADFLTQSYRVVGKMMVPYTGVVGMMNDPTTSFMEVNDAKLRASTCRPSWSANSKPLFW